MIAKLITAPVISGLFLDDIKEHLRIGKLESDHDDRIEPYLLSAIDEAQDMTGRALITQTWAVIFDSWAEMVSCILPFGQLQSVVSIKYNDEDGAEQTVSADDYLVYGVGTDDGKILIPSDSDFDCPSLYEKDPITVTFICGYGTTAASIHPPILSAIKLMVEEMETGADVRQAVGRLLNLNRLWSI